MGGPNYEIVNNSEDFGIQTVDFRHEQAAAMAAHAYRTCQADTWSDDDGFGTGNAQSSHGDLQRVHRQRAHGHAWRCRPSAGHHTGTDFKRSICPTSLGLFPKSVIRPTDPARFPEHISDSFQDGDE